MALEVVGLDDLFVMHGADPRRDQARKLALVVAGLVEPDREGLHRQRRLGRHQRDDGGGVEPTAEKRAEGHVASHADAHGVLQQVGELFLDGLAIAAHRRLLDARQIPVLRDGRAPTVGDDEMPRRELPDAAEKGMRRRDVAEREIDVEQLRIRLPWDAGGEQALHLRAEQESRAVGEVVQGLDAEPVPREKHVLTARIPERERPHSVKFLQAFRAPAVIGLKDDFSIGVCSEPVAEGGELGLEFDVVVYFAVVNDDVLRIRVHHWLMSGGRVDDGKPPMPQADARCPVKPARVRAAVLENVGHSREQVLIDHRRPVPMDDARDAAHIRLLRRSQVGQ